MNTLVRTVNICMDFQSGESKTRVLHDISIKIPTSKLTMLVGPSGCGKTTLLSIISGILTPSSGKIYIGNEDIFALTDYEKVLIRRKKIGFIFQQYNLLPTLTAAENAAIPLIAAGINIKTATIKAKEILAKINMLEHSNKTPNRLSGGQQQRVAIARALIHSPDLIICDEPTAALDEKTGIHIMEILKNLTIQSGKTILIVTHDNRIFKFADSIIHMNDGKIVNYDDT